MGQIIIITATTVICAEGKWHEMKR